ncbi:MAG: 3-oxoacyl-ACP reductase [Chloroflexi bacterium]|nr:MAG: 3-oxoacyl-ACP reductase [Chloroflexota bacterium]MBA4375660.1 beta-ketoacyl-ACP reductase [Anaerolinea sp.]
MRPINDAHQVAIVTGASEGIGQAIAQSLLRSGYRVVLVSRNETKLKLAISSLGELVQHAWIYPADLTISSQVDQMVKAIIEREGRVDVVVNNLGQGLRRELVATTDQEWDHLVHINLTSAFYCCRAILPVMRTQKSGFIINIASRAGRHGEGQFAAYSALKHGLVGLTRAIADSEAEYGIKVNAVCPGLVATTTMLQKYPTLDHSNWNTPDEVSHAVLFLLSPAASPMNGQCLDLFRN